MKKILYTSIMGNYDKLLKPTMITEGWDYICYTNNPNLTSDVWKIVYVPTGYKSDYTKNARNIKILPPFEYDLCIWVDGNIQVTCNLDRFVVDYHRGNFSIMKHPLRDCLYEEAQACIDLNKDKADVISSQIERYSKQCFPPNFGLVASGVIVRSKCYEVDNFCGHWWKEVVNYSKRDQLSFNYISWKHTLSVNLMPYSIIEHNQFSKQLHGR